jgi:hypothetical protein
MLYDINEVIKVLQKVSEYPNTTRQDNQWLKNACVLLREYDKDLGLALYKADRYAERYHEARVVDLGVRSAAISLENTAADKGPVSSNLDSIQDPKISEDSTPNTPKKRGRPSKTTQPVHQQGK